MTTSSYQSLSNGYSSYLVQSGLGVQSSGGGGKVLRQTGGIGARMSMATIASQEIRADMMRNRGRHGSQRTNGAWTGEASFGSHDDIIEAIIRGTRTAADLAITQGDVTSITTGANTIIGASGSWLSLGLRVGDIVRLTGHSSTGNNSRNLRVTGVSATTLTVAETLTVNAVADTTITITRSGKKLINPAAGALVKRYFTIEDVETDLDQSEVLTDFVFGGIKFSMQPNGIIMVDVSGIGTGQFTTLTGASSPLLTSPTDAADVPFAVIDATIRVAGNDLIDLTGFDLTIDNGPSTPDVLGPTKYAPDVFPGQMAISMNLTALRKDLQFVTDFTAETAYSLHVLAVSQMAEPKDFLSIYVPNFTLGSVDKAALSARGGARTQTIAVPAALVGQDLTGGAYDATMIKIQS